MKIDDIILDMKTRTESKESKSKDTFVNPRQKQQLTPIIDIQPIPAEKPNIDVHEKIRNKKYNKVLKPWAGGVRPKFNSNSNSISNSKDIPIHQDTNTPSWLSNNNNNSNSNSISNNQPVKDLLGSSNLKLKQTNNINNDSGSFILIVGIYNDKQNADFLPVGCGKTLFSTYLGYELYYRRGKQVFSTYDTKFSTTVDPPEFMSLYAKKKVMPGDLFIVDEIDRWLSPQNRRGASGKMLHQCISVRRQMQIDIIATAQRYMDVVKFTREQTDKVYVVQKFHPPMRNPVQNQNQKKHLQSDIDMLPEHCTLESCPRNHVIIPFRVLANGKDIQLRPVLPPIPVERYGHLYNTYQIASHAIDDLFFSLAKEEKAKRKLMSEINVPSFSNPKY
jgi:hypothetical protein